MMPHQTENINEEIQTVIKNKLESLEIKSKINEKFITGILAHLNRKKKEDKKV